MSCNPLSIKIKIPIGSAILAFLLLFGCKNESSFKGNSSQKAPVASVKDDTLYAEDIQQMFEGSGQSVADSQALRKTFIDRWIRKKLLFHKALKNLSPDKKDKDEALQKYYESLIRHTFEKSVIQEKLDTDISTDSMNAYYDNNKSRFQLKAPILQIRYLAVPAHAPNQRKIPYWFQSDKNYHLDSLFQYANTHAKDFLLDISNWYYYDNLRKRFNLPEKAKPFLTQNTVFQTELDSATVLHLSIQDYQLANTTAPFSLKKDKIRKIMLNQRKKALIDKVEEQTIREGLQQDKVQRYD